MKTNRWTRVALTLALTTALALLLSGGTVNAKPRTSCFGGTRLVNGTKAGVASLYTYVRVPGKQDYPVLLRGVRAGLSKSVKPEVNLRAEHLGMLLCIDLPHKPKEAKKTSVLQLIVTRRDLPKATAIKSVNVLLGMGKYGKPSAQAVLHLTRGAAIIRPFRPADPKACEERPDDPGLILWGGNTLPFVHFRLKNGTTDDEVASAEVRGHSGPVKTTDDVHTLPPPMTPPAATDYETSVPDKTHPANWAEVCVVVRAGPRGVARSYAAEILLPDPRCQIEYIELDMTDGSGDATQIQATVYTYFPDPPDLPCGGPDGLPLVVNLEPVPSCVWRPADHSPYGTTNPGVPR